MISGVKVNKKKQFIDERGKIMRMLRVDDEEFSKFGEIYFSYTYYNTHIKRPEIIGSYN